MPLPKAENVQTAEKEGKRFQLKVGKAKSCIRAQVHLTQLRQTQPCMHTSVMHVYVRV